MTIAIITDSSSDIPTSLSNSLEISVIPCHVTINDIDYKDGVDLTGDDNKIHTDKGYASTTTFKKPVATSNQALFWSSIRKIGIKDSIPNYGKLLTKSYN